MIKYKRVYICDHCGIVALEEKHFFMYDVWRDAPDEWTKVIARGRLCG